MKIGMQRWGSHGDIRPFLALAKGLQSMGYQVTLYIANAQAESAAFQYPSLSNNGIVMNHSPININHDYYEKRFYRTKSALQTKPHFIRNA